LQTLSEGLREVREDCDGPRPQCRRRTQGIDAMVHAVNSEHERCSTANPVGERRTRACPTFAAPSVCDTYGRDSDECATYSVLAEPRVTYCVPLVPPQPRRGTDVRQ